MFVQLASTPSVIERYGTRENASRITGISTITLDKYSTDVMMESHCILNGKLMTHDRRSKPMQLPDDAPAPKRGRKKMVLQHATTDKTFCRNGHERTPETTYVYEKTGYAQCRVCRQNRYANKKNPKAVGSPA